MDDYFEYFNSMSDEQVLQIARMVDTDLTDAAENQCAPDSPCLRCRRANVR